jgi:uncharacterized membrane protein YhfC
MLISFLSVIFIAVSAIVQIGTPICLFIYFRKKFEAKVLPLIFGVFGFVIFVLLLESLVHSIVFRSFPLMEKPVIYVVYGIFMAGIFEETARFISFNILKRKYGGIGTGLAYGVGHGGIESILLAGITMIINIVISVIANTGMITSVFQGDVLAAINGQIEALTATAPYMFLISGFERLMAIIIQISLSVIVFYSVYNKKLFLFPLAILLHAVIDIPSAAFQVGLIKSIFPVEGILLLFAAISVVSAKFIHDKLKTHGSD